MIILFGHRVLGSSEVEILKKEKKKKGGSGFAKLAFDPTTDLV
jgi:hypothetical protein